MCHLKRAGRLPDDGEQVTKMRLLALRGLSAAARGVGAGAAVGLDVCAGSLVLYAVYR